MSQPFTFPATNNRSPLRIGQIISTVLAFLSLALGSLLLSLVWFGVGTTPGSEARAFAFILLWPATMLTVWFFSTSALILAKRALLAFLCLPAAFAILFGVWFLVVQFLLNLSGVLFTALFILLNTGALWLASWFLRSTSR